ncbi:MAG: PQQ-dependent sugar dehydrogenase [Ginsengibacter sp.]
MKRRSKENNNKQMFPILKLFRAQTILFLMAAGLYITSCRKHDMPPPSNTGSYDLKLVAGNLVSPVTVAGSPDNTGRLFIVDQIGKVWIVDNQGNTLANPFIDITNKMVSLNPFYDERGLLSMAFHPRFKSNGKFFLFYTAPPRTGGPEPGVDWNNLTRISEYSVSAGNPNVADVASEKIIFEADHPQGNHNGGTIAFGPDGFLYISIGDGGNADDKGPGHVADWYEVNEGGNGQDIKANLLGNILRIDVDKKNESKNYGIPGDNPFAKKQGKDEIYAFGFRNPYRFSFDMGGEHWLYAGDAGQLLYEEIDIVKKGGNYGWNVKEGTHCFNTDNSLEERVSCPSVDPFGNPLIDPVIEINNSRNPKGGSAITIVGGNVYRGKTIPSLEGKYIFGILSESFNPPTGKLLVAKPSNAGLWSYEDLKLKSFPENVGQYVKGFGQDEAGEVYATTSGQIGPQGATGKVYKIVFMPD